MADLTHLQANLAQKQSLRGEVQIARLLRGESNRRRHEPAASQRPGARIAPRDFRLASMFVRRWDNSGFPRRIFIH